MKKTYIAPAVKIVKLNTERMIALSGQNGGAYSDIGIGYGGIDLGGGIVVGVKQDNPLLNNVLW